MTMNRPADDRELVQVERPTLKIVSYWDLFAALAIGAVTGVVWW